MKKAILTDFLPKEEWTFQRELEKETKSKWEILCLQSNNNHGGTVQTAIRYLKYFYLPFRVFLKREYDCILAWQQFYGIILAFYLRLFCSKYNPQLTVMTFIFKPKESWLGRLYFWFVHYAVTSKYIDRIIVCSHAEVMYYTNLFGVEEGKFVFIPLGIEDERNTVLAELEHQRQCVSAGRSNRDYDFLKTAWEKQNRELRIICDEIETLNTKNVVCLKNTFGDAYLKEIAKAHAVIVPLKSERISSGQLVLLHAMMLGKPVIVTHNSAVQDYICNGVNGIVIEKTDEALDEALKRLEDHDYYHQICNNARETFEHEFSLGSFGAQIGKMLKEAAQKSGVLI